jgi:hypothetical protein
LGLLVASSVAEVSAIEVAASVVTAGWVGGVVNDSSSPSVVPIELEAIAQK